MRQKFVFQKQFLAVFQRTKNNYQFYFKVKAHFLYKCNCLTNYHNK